MRFELKAVPLEKWIEKQERLNRFFVKGLESEFIIDDNKKEVPKNSNWDSSPLVPEVDEIPF